MLNPQEDRDLASHSRRLLRKRRSRINVVRCDSIWSFNGQMGLDFGGNILLSS